MNRGIGESENRRSRNRRIGERKMFLAFLRFSPSPFLRFFFVIFVSPFHRFTVSSYCLTPASSPASDKTPARPPQTQVGCRPSPSDPLQAPGRIPSLGSLPAKTAPRQGRRRRFRHLSPPVWGSESWLLRPSGLSASA